MTEAATLRLILSLLAIIAMILAGAWVARRSGWLRTGGGDTIRILGSRSLGARASLAVVQIEDVRLVLGVTASQISLLHALPPIATGQAREAAELAGEPADADAPHGNFRDTLRRALSRRR